MRKKSASIAVERLNFLLPARSRERLDRLKEETEATSYAEVVKDALRVYEALLKEDRQGRRFLVADADNNVRELPIFMFH